MASIRNITGTSFAPFRLLLLTKWSMVDDVRSDFYSKQPANAIIHHEDQTNTAVESLYRQVQNSSLCCTYLHGLKGGNLLSRNHGHQFLNVEMEGENVFHAGFECEAQTGKSGRFGERRVKPVLQIFISLPPIHSHHTRRSYSAQPSIHHLHIVTPMHLPRGIFFWKMKGANRGVGVGVVLQERHVFLPPPPPSALPIGRIFFLFLVLIVYFQLLDFQ